MTLRDFDIDRNLSIYQQYQTTYLHVTQILGIKTAVLMQVGATYEIFCTTDVNNGNPSNNFYDLTNVMGLAITHRGKGQDGTNSNPNMAGFPIGSIRKYSNLLLNADYSIVICDQEDEDTVGHGKQRVIAQILTPGTAPKTNNLTANKLIILYVENQNPKDLIMRIDRADLCIGLCAMNVITGETRLFELQISPSHPKLSKQYNLEEVYRFLQSNNCRELVIHLKNFDITTEPNSLDRKNAIETYFKETLALDQYFIQQFAFNEIDDNWLMPKYQATVLEKLFADRATMGTTTMSSLGLEYMSSATTAYLITLEHVRQRNNTLVKRLPCPEVWKSENVMILTHNAVQQLELCPSTSIDTKSRDRKMTLFEIIDNTVTPEGKRQLEQLLFAPYYDPVLLEMKYAQVQAMIDTGKDFISSLTKPLREIGDLRKLHRRLETDTLSPSQLFKLMTSYDAVVKLQNTLQPFATSIPVLSDEILGKFEDYRESLKLTFNVDKLNECKSFKTISSKIVNAGLVEELDLLHSKVGNLDVMIFTHFFCCVFA
ncbi:MAG: hypothetical protein ACMG6E_06550 [Candidatus Roizmanbacteria bacterium]